MIEIIIEKYKEHSDRDLLHIVLVEFHFLNLKIDTLMNKAEFIQAITDLKTEVSGVADEVDVVSGKVDNLESLINNAGDAIPDDVASAFADLKSGVDILKGKTDGLNSKADNTPAAPPADQPVEAPAAEQEIHTSQLPQA